MGGYFEPWRRKIGVMALVMALLAMGGWVRSVVNLDIVEFTTGDHSKVGLESGEQTICLFNCYSTNKTLNPRTIFWCSISFHDQPNARSSIVFSNEYWRWQICGFGYQFNSWRNQSSIPSGAFKGDSIFFPYWSITIPPTLLSVYLLLTKPQKSNQKKIVEPIPAEGK